MIVESLKIAGIGGFFSEKSISFHKGLNVIVGNNETGKSTLLKALFSVLFGMNNAAEKNRYKSWNRCKDYYGEMVVSVSGKRLRIKREYETDETIVSDVSATEERIMFHGKASIKGSSEESSEYRRFLQDMLGTADPVVFRNTACVFQSELKISDRQLSGELRKIITGSHSMDCAKIEQKMVEDLEEITADSVLFKRPKKNARVIERLEKKIRNNKEELAQLREKTREILKIKRNISEQQETLEADKSVYESKHALYEKLLQLQDLKSEEKALRDDLSEIEQEINKTRLLESEINALQEKRTAEFAGLENLPPDFESRIKTVRSLEHEIETLRQKIADTSDAAGFISSLLSRMYVWLPGLAGIIMLVITFAVRMPEIAKGLMRVLGLPLVLASLFTVFKLYKKIKRRLRLAEFYALEEHRLKAKYGQACSDAGGIDMVKNAEETVEKWRLMLEVNETIRVNRKALDINKSNRVHEKEQAVLLDLRLCKERGSELLRENRFLDAYKDMAVNEIASEMIRLSNELRALRARNESAEQGIQALEIKQEHLAPVYRGAEEIEEEIMYDELFLKRAGNRQAALELAIKTLRECRILFQKEYGRSLETRLGTLFSDFTDNRYSDVVLSCDGDMHVHPKKYEEKVPTDFLSCGSRDLLYLLLRLMLAEKITGEMRSPLFFDDILVNFDSGRHQKALKLIRSLSETRQIVYFTHNRDIIKECRPVLDLDLVKETRGAK